MRKRFLLIAIITLFTSLSFAQEWVYIGSKVEKDETFYMCQYKKGVNNATMVSVWVKTVSKRLLYLSLENKLLVTNGFSLELMQFDCINQKAKILIKSYFDINMIMLSSFDLQDEAEWMEIKNGTLAEDFLNEACARY